MSGLRPRKPLCAFVDLGSDWMFGIESGGWGHEQTEGGQWGIWYWTRRDGGLDYCRTDKNVRRRLGVTEKRIFFTTSTNRMAISNYH